MTPFSRWSGCRRTVLAESHARRRLTGIPLRTGLALALLGLALAATAAAPLDTDAEAEKAFAQALQAIQAEQWGQAELLLERALMLNPEHAGARIEMAGLLSARRKADAARALIQSLIDDPRTPEPHRARLRAMLAGTGQGEAVPEAPVSRPAEVLTEVFVGRMKNPLARADLRELTLTFPGGPITLPIRQDVRPGTVMGVAVRRTVPGTWSLEATVQRLTGGESANASRLGASGRLPLPLPDFGEATQALWQVQTQRAFTGTSRHAAGLALNGKTWGLSAGGFDETTIGRHGAFARIDRLTQPWPSLLAVVFLEGEYAVTGPPSFWRTGAAAAWAPAPGWGIVAQADLVRDLAGYSPLLENGARRAMESVNLSVERSWQPGGPDWQLLGRAFVGRRWSNLALFGYRDAGLQISLRRRW